MKRYKLNSRLSDAYLRHQPQFLLNRSYYLTSCQHGMSESKADIKYHIGLPIFTYIAAIDPLRRLSY